MAATFNQEAVLDFLLLHRGKVRNVELTAHFNRFLRDPERQPQSRELFKKFVNSLAVVKLEGGDKYIVLKKRYVELLPEEIDTSGDAVPPARPVREEKERQRAAQCTQLPPAAAAGQLSESPLRPRQRQQEAAVAPRGSNAHRPATAQEKAAPNKFAKRPAGAVQEGKVALVTALRGGNRAEEANGCTSVREGCPSQPEPTREDAKRANVDQAVRQRDSRGVINRRGGPALCKSTEQKSTNLQSKNRRGPVSPSHCTGDNVRVFNGDSKGSSNSTASPNISHLTPPPSGAKCKGQGEPLHRPTPEYNSVVISDAPVTENLQLNCEQNPPENFAQKSEKRFPREQRQSSATTQQNKMINHWQNPLSSKKRGSTDKVQKISPGLPTESDTKVLVNSAINTEECVQKNQRKLSQQQSRASAGGGQPLGNKWHSKGQSILPKIRKPSLKNIIKSNGLPHKMPTVPLVSNKSTTPKIVDRETVRHKNDQPVSLAQTESHNECRNEDPLKTEGASEKPLLDPTEHEWVVKTAVGRFEQAYALFCKDPNFAMKKDFISGYTVLHWIAKHGNHRALSRFINGASKMKVKLNVNIKSTCGYTPLHIAVIHEQLKIIQYLVKKYQANVNLRDHSGKKPWQYLNSESPKDVCQMLGAPAHKCAMHSENNSTFPAKNNKQGLSPAISRKTSFTALLKSPRVLHNLMHWDSDRPHTIIEDNEQD
ncbi:ankyrin repeat domain-containing protein SOWAHB [Mustelus asterias]